MNYKNVTFVESLDYLETATYECEILRAWRRTVRVKVVSITQTRYGEAWGNLPPTKTPTKKVGDIFNTKLENLFPYCETTQDLETV